MYNVRRWSGKTSPQKGTHIKKEGIINCEAKIEWWWAQQLFYVIQVDINPCKVRETEACLSSKGLKHEPELVMTSLRFT